MPGQRTFTVIPTAQNPPPPQYIRPMTTKQVRKAYKAATKTPPMSRAERIKQERAEQERIRKEFEKEKAAAKARLLREKKRDRELAEREQKKKMGIPLVNVRPSQDTIARFVRGNGYGKKRDSGGETLERLRDGMRDEAGEQGEDDTGSDKRELDLIPEGDESDLEELLDTITGGTSEMEAQMEARGESNATSPTNHTSDPENASESPHKTPPKHSPRPISGPMGPPPRPNLPKQQTIPSPPPIIQQPPMSTQAILGNLDDFFPSSSQQALELQDETFDSILSDSFDDAEYPVPQKPSPAKHILPTAPSKRFFTSSGSNELVSLAIQRSKRTAALEELQDQEIPQANHTTKIDGISKGRARYSVNTVVPSESLAGVTNPKLTFDDKENATGPCGISDSQETEYGGDWVDELALDLVV
ncbi:AMP-dependent synthetase/ligase [Pochonia chlamydosporia 170]|uniref:AMP-dependent synthetase/ligase n=1 Tax=Pochonia chlamydosporia 170 TaxID=1380566 RepID=A0A179G6V3_METCM|nr:AMP-dependent synthetase/ligase [Pochonia chlamydosporia 170]OAQ73524.1 AMP-dependent synthetase/ligase [Pochonia chlamydosporia 170]